MKWTSQISTLLVNPVTSIVSDDHAMGVENHRGFRCRKTLFDGF